MREEPSGARSVRSEWAEWDLTSESWKLPTRITVEEYRSDGKLLSSEMRFPNESACRSTNSYDESGLLIERQFQNGDAPAGRTILVYDEWGRLIRQMGRAPDGAERVAEEHVYGAEGEHTKIIHLPPMEGARNVLYGVEGVDYSLSATGITTMTTVFDSHGRVSEVLLKDVNSVVLRRVVLTRDESGRLVKDEVLLGADPSMPDIPQFAVGAVFAANEYTYDERGRRVGVVRRMFGLSEQRETIRFDDRDNQTEITTEENCREGDLREGIVEYGPPTQLDRRQARFEYKYDSRGNWVECVTSQRYGENPDFTPGSIERRKIAYYDDSHARIG